MRRRTLVQAGQEGSSLIIAMVCMIVMGVLLAALAAYTQANERASVTYRDVRNERYAGDAAVKAAVNWAANNDNVGRDPNLSSTDPACVYDVPTAVGTVTATCAADAGGGSGLPASPGVALPEGLTLLGTRKVSSNSGNTELGDETGPYNVPACKGWWNSVTGFFDAGTDPVASNPGEWSAYFKKRKGLGTLGATCDTDRNRSANTFIVDGKVVAAGRIEVQYGGLQATEVKAANGCAGAITPAAPCPTPGARSGLAAPLDYLNTTNEGTDPARWSPGSPAADPFSTARSSSSAAGDIREPFRAVGFKGNGEAKDLAYAPTTLMPQAMPVRTTAYFYDGSSATGLTATSTCGGSTATVIFLPGWYKDADVLNRYTTSPSCKNVTFWFAPDPGPDGRLLTADDRTGAYYFDFTGTTGTECGNGLPANAQRWCVGNSADQNARVVAGTPNKWQPQGSAGAAPPGSPDARTRIRVTVDTATTTDDDLSQSWANGSKASKIDEQPAKYHATFLNLSIDRAFRVRNFVPKVTAAPMDEPAAGSLPAAPKGRIYASVRYGVTNPTRANVATVDINTVGKESGQKFCGTYSLFTNKNDADYASGLHTYTFNDAQAKQLADTCGTVDLINGYEITLKVAGNPFNYPTATDVYFDGVSFSYDTVAGPNFPNPTGPGGTLPDVTAQRDCDPAKPGAQFIFGGASNLYVSDGSAEICAGPYPTDPENHESIGVYGVPQVADVNAVAIVDSGGNDADPPSNTGNITAIDKKEVTINYGGCAAFCGGDHEEGWVKIKMGAYTPPTGYAIDKIQARVSYNPKNGLCAFGSCPGRAPTLRFPDTPSCTERAFPKNPDNGPLQVAQAGAGLVYGGGQNCIDLPKLAAGTLQLQWVAQAGCTAGVCKPFGGQYHDTIDGIALQISLKPTDTSKPWLKPQSGCITAHPNYGSGTGNPDCAIIRADTADFADNWHGPFTTIEGRWTGRLSVEGTIYAPSAAIEVDDTDVAYPLATRGAVLRHLRVSGWGFRQGYSGSAISNEVKKTPPSRRDATFVACIQSSSRRGLPVSQRACDASKGDRILTRARVGFDIDATGKARLPNISWWTDVR